MKYNWKNIILALLVVYVTIDLLATYATGLKHNGALTVFAQLGSPERRTKAALVILLGAAIGYFTYRYVSKDIEAYNPNPESLDDQYTNGSMQDVDSAFADNVALLN